MIWTSIVTMSVIDISIVGMTCALALALFRHRQEIHQLQLMRAMVLTLIGLLAIALFYFVDLVVMLVLPRITGHEHAMRVMTDLHHNWSWPNALFGVAAICIGISVIVRRLIPGFAHALEGAESAGAALYRANEVLEQRIAERTRELEEDIAARRQVEAMLRESELSFRNVFEASPTAIWVEDWSGVKAVVESWGAEGRDEVVRFLDANPDALRDAAGGLRSLHVNQATLDLYGTEDEAGFIEAADTERAKSPSKQFRADLLELVAGSTSWVSETVDTKFDGSTFRARFSISVPEEHRERWSRVYTAVEDITQFHDISRKLSHEASHDALTGLVNRREFDRRLTRIIDIAHTDATEHALCYIDLDQFKVVNDSFGHAAGDELLRQLGGHLRTVVRRRDTVARLGGDEFGVLMEDCAIKQARRVAESVQNAVVDFRFTWGDRVMSVGASIGLVPIDGASGNNVDVLKAADSACYVAKDQGGNRIQLYRPGDEILGQRRSEMQWATRIATALEEDRFTLMSQAFAPADPAAPPCARHEVLLRMVGEDGEIISPGAFLPAAGRYGLLSRIDTWVVRNVLRWYSAHPAALADLELCNINLSGPSLGDDDFLAFVVSCFEATGVPPEKFCFEITETAAIADAGRALDCIDTLKRIGCSFALDDFGSGLSSFSYLKTLPVDYVKIDGFFVRDIMDDPVDLAMVRAIHEIANLMGKRTIAEFVETDAIRERLQSLGVHFVQGYVVGYPQPLGNLDRRAA